MSKNENINTEVRSAMGRLEAGANEVRPVNSVTPMYTITNVSANPIENRRVKNVTAIVATNNPASSIVGKKGERAVTARIPKTGAAVINQRITGHNIFSHRPVLLSAHSISGFAD